ncbi:MAG: hypothetical protein SFX73_08860 [Kofleriaceae bacterium]|nr:hypothetical protein [Kofleriaceae bacterium]
MRCLAFVCVLVATMRVAFAQAPDPVPPPDTPDAPPTDPGDAPTDPSAPTEATVPAPAAPPVTPPPAKPTIPTPPPKKSAAEIKEERARAEQQCAAKATDCDWVATRSSLERLSVRRAITARGYEVEPSPWGKVIGKIEVYNEDVFAEKNRLLGFFNHFHVTSKEFAVRREVVVRSGDVYNQLQIEESERRLRDPMFTSVIAIIPIKSKTAGQVDVLVVTRDIWSLRLNTAYTVQQGELTNLAISLSENNFLGRRKVVAAAFTMDQGAIATGPLYIDKNFLGKYIDFRARVNTIINRDALLQDGRLDNEGSSSTITLSKTLWKLSSKWGWGTTFTHRFAIDRRFAGTELRGVRCPLDGSDCELRFDPALTPEAELLPWIYNMKRWGISTYAVRQWGTKVKQQATFGYSLDSQRPTLLSSFTGTPEQRAPLERAILPRSGVTSVPYVSYALFTPRFRTRRNVQTYDLAEDLRLGPDLDISYGVGLKALGSTSNFQRGGISAGYTLPWCKDGSARLSGSLSSRLQNGEFFDNAATLNARIVTPTRCDSGDIRGGAQAARLVIESTLGSRSNNLSPTLLTIGSDNGLRGYNINEFFGQRLFGTQAELRTYPIPVWVFRAGAVVFYEFGGAADTFKELELHHDVGFGIRALTPQTSRELFRFDLAFPMDGPDRGKPKFSAGFQQEF